MSKPMKDMITRAISIAQTEVADGRRVMVLFPNAAWQSAALPQSKIRMNIFWLRASTNMRNLKSIAIDTLILVNRDHPDWVKEGERLARCRLQGSLNLRVIVVIDE